MEIYTIGFTRRTARDFFETLREHTIKRLVDVRLNNSSQLAGFSKRDDLAYFLQELCGAEYIHEPLLAPSEAMLVQYRKHRGSWEEYQTQFLCLLSERKIEERLPRDWFATPAVLLCSEPSAEHCHRGIVVEYLGAHWGAITARHL